LAPRLPTLAEAAAVALSAGASELIRIAPAERTPRPVLAAAASIVVVVGTADSLRAAARACAALLLERRRMRRTAHETPTLPTQLPAGAGPPPEPLRG